MTATFTKTEVFNELKKILRNYSDNLEVVSDNQTSFYLNTLHKMKNNKPLFFGAVQIKKNYVSYHLMPVYVNPSLLDGVSEKLQKCMQGKSCFNFKSIEAALFTELASLTETAYHFYIKEGYIDCD